MVIYDIPCPFQLITNTKKQLAAHIKKLSSSHTEMYKTSGRPGAINMIHFSVIQKRYTSILDGKFLCN